MKKLILFAVILFYSSSIIAQTADQVGWVSKFGVAGGFTPVWLFPNFDGLNNNASILGVDDFSSSGILTYGGGGYAYLMIIDNVRFGGMGFGGSSTQANNGKEISYSIGGGALSLEYTLPMIKRVAVSFGVLIGTGSIEVDIYNNKGNFNWSNLWDEAVNPDQSSTGNYYRKLTNSYYLLSPTLNIDLPINRFIAVRLGAGYQLTFAEDWQADNGKNISGVPSDLNGNSFFIQTGLFLGFFAF
jgi:hypothetical protein